MLNLEKSEHSDVGASTCERWWNCPGSVKLIKELPKQNDQGKYAAEGTLAHALAESILKKNAISSAESIFLDEIGRSYVVDGHEIEITEGMTEAVQVYLDIIRDYEKQYRLKYERDIRIEETFNLQHLHAEAFGKCDAVITVYMNRIIVIDYKHGKGVPVEVKDNKQLLYYALGAYYTLKESDRNDIAWVESVIIQPRAPHIDGSARTYSYTKDELLNYEQELKKAFDRVKADNSELKTGLWCRFCGAKAVCPAQRMELERIFEIDFSAVDVKPVTTPDVALLTPEKLGHLMKNASKLKEWIESVIALSLQAADSGIPIEGYQYVLKYGNRRWKDERAVEDTFKPEFGEFIFNKKLKSPTQMEKLLKSKRKAELEPYYETPITGKTLALITDLDKREPISDTQFDTYVP